MYKILGGDGKQYGPIPAETLREWIQQGRANAETQVLAEGATSWQALGTIAEFADVLGAPPSPRNAPQTIGAGATVPNYLVQSILVTLCCCVPLGIVAIVYSAQVNGKLAAGDIAGAQEAAKKAKMWGWIAFGSGILVGLIWGVLQFLVAAASGMSGSH